MTAVFIVKGRRFPVPERFTLGEQREMKRVAGIIPSQLDSALSQGDPDALVAVLLVTMRRIDPKVTEATLDDLDIGDVVFDAGEEEGVTPVPPVEAPPAS
jgi:hypothetical protein